MVGALRAGAGRSGWLTVRPSAQPRLGSWHDAQASLPLDESLASKKSVFPSVTLAGLSGFDSGCTTVGRGPISRHSMPGSIMGGGQRLRSLR